MKKTTIALLNTFRARLSGLAATLLVAGGVWLAPSPSQADTQDDAAFTCASAVNVMDCIQQTGAGTPVVQQSSVTAVPINSQALGFTGPVSLGLRYDNYLAWILDVGYAQAFHSAAAAFKLSAGLNERRANVTLGYSITPKQQIKLTYEYLAQNLPFDYASGTINQWVNQNAMGGAYRYLLDHGMVRALELYGNYTKANSKELPEVEMYTDNVLTQIDYRRIAGGTQENVGGAVTLTPFKGTILKVGAGYSSLSFDTKWEDNEATAALAYNAEVSQLLTPTVLVSGGIGTTAAGSTYTAKVSKILPWSLEASLMGQYMAATSDIPGSTSVTAGLSYPAPKTYTNLFAQGIGNLKEWVQQPVIYNTRVLAKAEEKLVQVQITKKADIPAQSVPVNLSLTPTLESKDYFSFDPEVYTKINYTIDSIVTKADKKPIDPSLNNLNLGIKYLDSYNAEVLSLTPTTQAMIPNGQDVIYTVSLLAQGYRDSGIVSTLAIPFDLTVKVNQGLKAAKWTANPTLPSANFGVPYNNGNPLALNDPQYITPAIPGETFTFQITENPAWITLTSDNKSLIAKGNVDTKGQSTTLTLKATSQASGQVVESTNPNDIENQVVTIPINSSLELPKWKAENSLPAATVNTVYSLPNNKVLDPYSAQSGDYLTQTQLNQKPDLNDKVTFQVNTTQNGPSPCTWLKVLPDGTVTSNGLVTGGDCFAYIDVISQDNNNVPSLIVYPNTQFLGPKITVNQATYTLPTWQPSVNLPSVVNNTAYPSMVLNPYAQGAVNPPLLTKTIENPNTPLETDNLTFSMIYNQGSNADASCTWLSFTDADSKGFSKTGTIGTTVSSVANKTCTVYLSVTSDTAGETQPILPGKKITVATLPQWIPSKIPTIVGGAGVTFTMGDLNPYSDKSGGYLTTTSDAFNPKLDDSLTNFSIPAGHNDCDTWLGLEDSTNGKQNGVLTVLPGQSIPITNQTCHIDIVADSTYQKGYQLPQLQIKVQPPNAPQWNPINPYPVVITYPVSTDDGDGNGNYKLYYSTALVNQDATGVTFSSTPTVEKNLPSTGIASTTVIDGKGAYVPIKPTTLDIDNRDLQTSQAVGKFSINATSGGTSTGNFAIQVNAWLDRPQATATPMPNYVPNAEYVDANNKQINLDPYKGSPYLAKTTVHGTSDTLGGDSVQFYNDPNASDPSIPTCKGTISVDKDGNLSGYISNLTDNQCKFFFKVYSTLANDNINSSVTPPTTSVIISSGFIAPKWQTPNNPPQIKFDTTTVSTDSADKIDLSSMLATQADPVQTPFGPSFQFYFTDQGPNNLSYGNWKIIEPTPSDPHYYLVRQPNLIPNTDKNAFDATSVASGFEAVSITAFNALGSLANNLTVAIKSDPNVQFQVNTDKNKTIDAVVGTQTTFSNLITPNDPINSYLQTITNDGTLIINDKYGSSSGSDPQNAMVTNNGKTIAYYDPSIHGVVIPDNLDNVKDIGLYSDPKLWNVYSFAKGSTIIIPNIDFTNLKINIIPYANWTNNPFSTSIRFNVTDLSEKGTTDGPIYLNNFVDSPASVPGLRFQFPDGNLISGNYQIYSDNEGKDWYLIRRTLSDGGITYIDATDVSVNSTPMTIQVCSSNSPCQSGTNNITVKSEPDPTKVKIYWIGGTLLTVPNQGNSSAQCQIPFYSQGSPFDTSQTLLATYVGGIRVKDSISMDCMPGGGAGVSGDAYLGTDCWGDKRIGYLGGTKTSANSCNYTVLISMPYLNDGDHCNYDQNKNASNCNHGDATHGYTSCLGSSTQTSMSYFPLYIFNLQSAAYGLDKYYSNTDQPNKYSITTQDGGDLIMKFDKSQSQCQLSQ